MELRKFIATTIREYLNENYNNIHSIKPYVEKTFKVKINSVLGDESMGVAYLTENNDVLKITPSISEYDISKKLIKTPNKYFPLVFSLKKLPNGWYGIHKEYIPPINEKIKQDYMKLEKSLNEWFEDEDNNDLMMHKLIDTRKSLFKDYLLDVLPNIVYLYEELMEIVDFTVGIVHNNAVDIHVDNLGIKNNNIVLFDY
jgi:hypothetical protein